MKYLSMFSGIGGFEKGIQQAYVAISSRQREQQRRLETTRGIPLHGKSLLESEPVCVGFSEIDKYAIQIYQNHYPEHKNYGSATTIIASELPDFDLLCGGFPCQSFSIAGKRRGFDDVRGTLFFDIARILKEKQPRLLVLENVKGLLSHDNGRTFKVIIATLTELGYDCQWQVLNSKNFGVPQNRERIYIVGHLRGTPRPEVFPIGQDGGETDEVQGQLSNTLTARYEKSQATGTYIGESKLNAQENYPTDRPDSKQEPTESNIDLKRGWPQTATRIRRLTPVECERLQGFPDNWTRYGNDTTTPTGLRFVSTADKVDFSIRTEISDTQRYKCCGNAVTVNVVQAVIEKLPTPLKP